jgi:uncharacterized repeat protein (TIGR01451 family)
VTAVAAGLAALGTVGAQAPYGAYGQSKTSPPARPAGEWTANAPPAAPPGNVRPAGGYPPPTGYTQPAGQPARPRLTNAVVAGPDGVRPVGHDIPPPSMEMPAPPTAGVAPPAGSLPPPSVTAEPPAGPASPPLPPGVSPVPVPIPAVPEARAPATPVAPAGPLPPVPLPPGIAPVPPGSAAGTLPSPGTTPVRPATGGLPGRASHNVTVEAVCPDSIVFGQEFRYELIVKNAGTAPVAGVRVEDEIPAGAKYVGSDPPAELTGDHLAWSVGGLDAGAEKRIAVRVRPTDEGEVRSRAVVTFSAAVEARTKVTRPRIAVAVTGSELCKAGEEVVFQIKVTNSGSGPAQRMVVQAALSDGLQHPQGAKLEMEMANLPPGETRTVPLRVGAAKAGVQWCQVTVAAEGSQDSTAKASVNIVEPLLQITQTGPAKCLVRAEPTYEITLSNPGTATTDPIALYAILPEGFEFVQASDSAVYSAPNRAVVWKLAGLAPGGTKPVTLKLRAAVAGDGSLRTIAQTTPEQPVVGAGAPAKPAGRVLEAKTETAIKAEGVAAVRFEVIDLDDPVEVGKEAVYEIRVMNQGTGACTNVQLVAALAEGTEYKGSSGPTQVKAQGQHLVFDPIATLGAKGEAVYRVKVRGTTAGDLRFRVQLTCDQVRTPVVKEESTRFYKE